MLLASAAAAVAMGAGVLSGAASADPGAADGARTAEHAAAVRADIAQIARQRGWSVREATRRTAWQETFASITAALRAAHPDAFAGAAVTGDGTGAWVGYAGTVPASAARQLSRLPVTVRLIGGRGYSEAELKRTLEHHYSRLYRRHRAVNGSGSYDVETGKIVITLQPGDGADRGAASHQPRRPASTNPAVDITVKTVDHLDNALDAEELDPNAPYVRGGGHLYKLDGGGNCTAGFNVIGRNTGRIGFATARHCSAPASLRYHNHGATNSTVVDIHHRIDRGLGDVAVYSKGSFGASNVFYYERSKTRRVHAVATSTPPIGQWVCHYGRTTNYSCSQVYRHNVINGIYYGLTAVKDEVSDYGDSGGPWFQYNTAYGIHQGRMEVGGARRSLFTPIRRIEERVGWMVRLHV